jgi:hypothetical protein
MRWQTFSLLSLPAGLFLAYVGCNSSSPLDTSEKSANASGTAGTAGSGESGAGNRAGGSGSPGGQPGGGMAGKGTEGGQGGQGQGQGGGGEGGQGTDAVWKPLGELLEIPIEILQEPTKHRMFSWKPCTWTDNPACEEIELGKIAPLSQYGGVAAQVHDNGQDVSVAFVVTRTEVAGLLDQEGHVKEAFKIPSNPTNPFCFFGSADVQGDSTYAFSFFNKEKGPIPACIVGKLGQPPLLFVPEWTTSKMFANPQSFALNRTRWAMWLGQSSMVSFETLKGNPPTIFSQTDSSQGGNVLSIDGLKQAGDHFISNEFRAVNGQAKGTLMISDGITKAIPLLPQAPDAYDASGMFADTHVAWFRGFGYKNPNDYEKVELWASKFSANPEQIQPYKVMDLDVKNIVASNSFSRGGWGRVLFYQGYLPTTIYIVDLTGKSNTVTIPLDTSLHMHQANGVTRTHAWFSVDDPGYKPARRLVRWKLPPGGTSPGELPGPSLVVVRSGGARRGCRC